MGGKSSQNIFNYPEKTEDFTPEIFSHTLRENIFSENLPRFSDSENLRPFRKILEEDFPILPRPKIFQECGATAQHTENKVVSLTLLLHLMVGMFLPCP